MMTLDQLVEPLQAEVIVGQDDTNRQPVGGVVASDLMSDILVVPRDALLIVTSMASDQMVRTADLVGAVGIVIVNGKQLTPSMLELARALEIPLLRTALPKYETCLIIGQQMAKH